MQASEISPDVGPSIVHNEFKAGETFFVRCFMCKKGTDLYARADLSVINKVMSLKFTAQIGRPFVDYTDWSIAKLDPNAAPDALVVQTNKKICRVAEEILIHMEMNSNIFTQEEINSVGNAIVVACREAFPYMNPAYSSLTIHYNGCHSTHNLTQFSEVKSE